MHRGFPTAVAFLTIIPVPDRLLGKHAMPPSEMLWWFTPIGLLIGGVSAGITYLATLVFPWPTCAAIAVFCLIALSGALHLDGFMDTCDGLGSRAPRERALEIMRDSRVGAFGVVGAVCLILLKFAFLVAVGRQWGLCTVVAAPVVGRLMQVGVLRLSKYARAEGGLAARFFQTATDPHCMVAIGLTLAVAVGTSTFVPMVIAVAVAGLCALRIHLKLGGNTGDTVGAISEIAELTCIAFMAVLVSVPG